MPDIQRMPLSSLVSTTEEIRRTGIKAVILFGIPSSKDRNARSAYDERGVVQQSVELLRKHFSNTLVIPMSVFVNILQTVIVGFC